MCLFQIQKKTGKQASSRLLGGEGRGVGDGAGSLTSVPTLRLWREERVKGSLLKPRESRAKGQGFQAGLPSFTFTEVWGSRGF